MIHLCSVVCKKWPKRKRLTLQVKQGEHAMRMLALANKREQDLEKELQRARAASDDADLKWQVERVRLFSNAPLHTHQCPHAASAELHLKVAHGIGNYIWSLAWLLDCLRGHLHASIEILLTSVCPGVNVVACVNTASDGPDQDAGRAAAACGGPAEGEEGAPGKCGPAQGCRGSSCVGATGGPIPPHCSQGNCAHLCSQLQCHCHENPQLHELDCPGIL